MMGGIPNLNPLRVVYEDGCPTYYSKASERVEHIDIELCIVFDGLLLRCLERKPVTWESCWW
jgi:hypothetical protein